MTTLFATSPDNVQIAYDCSGIGPALVLIHGGGSNRQVWHEYGYVERLQKDFTVIALDLRGHGESHLSINPTDYTTDKMGQDILSVADDCGFEQFILWGMSYGGKVSRYLAAKSDRIEKLIIMGTPMGPGTTDALRRDIVSFCEHWSPILQSQRDGTLDIKSLPEDELAFLQNFNVPVMMAWGQAMLDWPAIEPADLPCPTLWLIGSEDQPAMDNLKKYEGSLNGTNVQYHIFDGLDHSQVLEEIDQVFDTMLVFIKS